jgi:O-antigen/teichoic acid export membrane protein
MSSSGSAILKSFLSIMKQLERMPSIKLNVISRWLSYAIGSIIIFFLTPFVIKKLDMEGYGIWRLAVTIVGYYGFFDIAISSSITRFVARYTGQNDKISLNKTIDTAMAIYLAMAALVILISAVFANLFVGFFDKTPLQAIGEFEWLVRILGIATGLGFFGSLFSAIINAKENYVISSFIGTGLSVIKAALTVIFLMNGLGLVGAGLAILITTVFGVVINYIVCKRIAPEVKIRIFKAERLLLKMILGYSGITMVVVIGDLMRMQIDSVVIGKMIGFEEVAIYGIAMSLISQIAGFVTAGTSVLVPRYSNLEGGGRIDELRGLFVRSLTYSAFLGFGLCALAMIWGGNFIRLWVGDGFDRSIPVLWILSLAWTTDLSQSPSIVILYAMNKHRYYAKITLIEGVVKLGLALLLVKNFGIIGVALASAVPMVAIRVLLMPKYMSKLLGLSLAEYFKPFLLPLVSSVLVTGGCFLIGVFSNPPASNWFSLVVYGSSTAFALFTINIGLSYIKGLSTVSIQK